MKVEILDDNDAMARRAASEGARAIRSAIAERGEATIVVATGKSQVAVLAALTAAPEIDWARVTAFHLDEYLGLSEAHPASFRKYLKERFHAHVPALKEFVPVVGDAADVDAELARLNGRLGGRRVDVCFAGIGENGHLAFNDPPADFETADSFILVTLDEACKRQQLGEAWFRTIDDVPPRAISMSVPAIMRAERLIVSVPDERKAQAVRDALEGPLTPDCPASMLREHPNCTIFLDRPAASLLAGAYRA